MKSDPRTYLTPAMGAEILAEMQAMMDHIDALDPLIHQPTRLRLMALLAKQQEAVSYQAILERLQLHRSALGMQLRLLEQAGFLVIEKRLKGRYAVRWVALSLAGREAFAHYMDHLLTALALATRQEDSGDEETRSV